MAYFLAICYSIYGKKVWFQVIRNDRLAEIVFVVQLQTLHEISHRKKTLFENLTGALNATDKVVCKKSVL